MGTVEAARGGVEGGACPASAVKAVEVAGAKESWHGACGLGVYHSRPAKGEATVLVAELCCSNGNELGASSWDRIRECWLLARFCRAVVFSSPFFPAQLCKTGGHRCHWFRQVEPSARKPGGPSSREGAGSQEGIWHGIGVSVPESITRLSSNLQLITCLV